MRRKTNEGESAGHGSAGSRCRYRIRATNVSIYGVVDIGVAFERGGAAGSVTKLDGSGMHSGNRLGFRGMEDLGGGLSALLPLENGFNPDTARSPKAG